MFSGNLEGVQSFSGKDTFSFTCKIGSLEIMLVLVVVSTNSSTKVGLMIFVERVSGIWWSGLVESFSKRGSCENHWVFQYDSSTKHSTKLF